MKAISLFAGCGGDTLGMTKAGLKVVAFVEYNKHAAESHRMNFPTCKELGKDVGGNITKIKDSVFDKYRNKIDVIFSGAPCQGFSNAGKKNPDDPRNRLIFETLRVVSRINPKIVFIENVSGLVTKKSDDGESSIIDILTDLFDQAGYNLTTKIYKMTQFKVPQQRKRLFMIAVRKDTNFQWIFPDPTEKRTTLKNIIEKDMIYTEKFDINNVHDGDKIHFIRVSDELSCDNNAHKYITLKNRENRLSFGKRISPFHSEIIDINQPAKTIICTYMRQPRLLVPLKNRHGTYIRTLNINELKQIQGFPKDYKLSGNDTQKIIQIGNAVPPPAVEYIVRKLRKQMRGI